MSDIIWTDDCRKLSELKPQEDNPRQIHKAQAERLVKSWHKFGQPDVISIGPDNTIYNGHQRYWVWGAAYGEDCEVAVRVSSRPLTKREWQELTVYLHRGTVAEWDWDGLAEWDGVDVADLVEWGFENWEFGGAGEGNDIDKLWQGMPEFGNEAKAIKTLYVHFEIEEDIRKFEEIVGQDINEKTKYIWYPKKEKQDLRSLIFENES